MRRLKNKRQGAKPPLELEEVFVLAQYFAKRIGIYLPKNAEQVFMDEKHIEVLNSTNQFWVDKDYIAYSDYENTDVNYLYLTREHLVESRCDIREEKERTGKTSYSDYVINQLEQAGEEMFIKNKSYKIFEYVTKCNKVQLDNTLDWAYNIK